MIKSICQTIDKPVETLLDLGCGIGVVGITLMKHGIAKKLFASDITPESVQLTDLNCQNYNIEVEARISNVLDNWNNKRFNIIANDVSNKSIGFDSNFNEVLIFYKNEKIKNEKISIKKKSEISDEIIDRVIKQLN